MDSDIFIQKKLEKNNKDIENLKKEILQIEKELEKGLSINK